MALLSCKLCGNVFASSGCRTCQVCRERLDELYPRVRGYLREHSKVDFSVETIADEMDIPIRYIHELVSLGYLDLKVDRQTDSDALKRQKLAKEFENLLKQTKSTLKNHVSTKTYGQQRYG